MKCGPTPELTSGGNLTLGSGVYSMKSYTYTGEHTCANGKPHLFIQKEETLESIDQFCSHFDDKKITRGKEESKNYFQTVGGVMSTMKVEWYSKTVGCGKGDFRDTEYTIDKVGMHYSSLCVSYASLIQTLTLHLGCL